MFSIVDSEKVGYTDGDELGAMNLVGLMEGLIDGFFVEGAMDGILEGNIVGAKVGTIVGRFEGNREGSRVVGDADGGLDGFEVRRTGVRVGSEVTGMFGGKVEITRSSGLVGRSVVIGASVINVGRLVG